MRALFRENRAYPTGSARSSSSSPPSATRLAGMFSPGGARLEIAYTALVLFSHLSFLSALILTSLQTNSPSSSSSTTLLELSTIAFSVVMIINAYDTTRSLYRWHTTHTPHSQFQSVITGTFLLSSCLHWRACKILSSLSSSPHTAQTNNNNHSLDSRFAILFFSFCGALYALAILMNALLLSMPQPQPTLPQQQREEEQEEREYVVVMGIGDHVYLCWSFMGASMMLMVGVLHSFDAASCGVEYFAALRILSCAQGFLSAASTAPLLRAVQENARIQRASAPAVATEVAYDDEDEERRPAASRGGARGSQSTKKKSGKKKRTTASRTRRRGAVLEESDSSDEDEF